MDGIFERVKMYAQHAGITKAAFEKIAGLPNGTFKKSMRTLSVDTQSKIATSFSDLNIGWLLLGEGEMLKNSPARAEKEAADGFSAPLLPISAQGGTLNDFVTSVKAAECERIVSPIREVDFAMTVTGDSMAPDYPNGAQILIKKVDERAFIEWGRVYVLDTCNGSVIKELRKGADDDSVMCYSLNPDPKYQPFAVRFADIYGMYRVLMCMSLR